jgi:hypothetical protein
MQATHVIKQGYGYWDITNYPIGGCFRRATTDLEVALVSDPVRTSHGYLAVFETADNRRIAAQEQCFRTLDLKG